MKKHDAPIILHFNLKTSQGINVFYLTIHEENIRICLRWRKQS